MKKSIIIYLIFVTFIACAQESVELHNTVTVYNKMLAEALAKPDEHILDYFTSDNELARIGAYILRLKTEKKVMISELVKLEFIGTTLSDDGKSASVSSREKWNFHYVDDKTRERITDDESIEYENIYTLIKEENHWVVDSIEVKEK